MIRALAVLCLLLSAFSLHAVHRAVLVSPTRDLTDYDRAQLAGKGVVVMRALPDGRYLARVAPHASLSDASIASVEPLTAEKKIDAAAWRAAASGRSLATVHAIFHEDVTFDEARAAVLAAGGAIDVFRVAFLPTQRIEVKIPPHALTALASDEAVLAVAGPRKFMVASDNAASAALSGVDVLQAAPYGLTGDGVTVSLFELAGAQASHVEFGGRLTVAASTIGGSSGDARHATHVAGTIGAEGVKPEARGMAPKVRIHQYCVPSDSNQCTGDWLELKERELRPLGVTIDNNSWGYVWGWWSSDYPLWSGTDIYWGAYDLVLASPIDQIANDKDILFVHSAGNDGDLPGELLADPWRSHLHVDANYEEIPGQVHCVSQNGTGLDCPAQCNATSDRCELTLHHAATPFDTLGTTASAKNVLSVGAITSAKEIVEFSSRGPAKDGRVKPDVVARGFQVQSTIPNDSYGELNGTSMSAPAVTGMAALISEQWKRTYGSQPSAATVKALVIAGAEDLGNPGPDYTFGFGLANAKSSVDLILADGGRQDRIRTLSFGAGQKQVHELALVVTERQDLRVVLNWSDPAIPFVPGESDVAAKALVNDIDVHVIDPAGATVHPWILDKEHVQANATRGVNGVDNVEMVEIADAAPGVYRVHLVGTSVKQGTQSAVVVANARIARPCRDLQEGAGNDAAERAWGSVSPGQLVSAGLCSPGDIDFYRFDVTRAGAIEVTLTAGDTPLRATLAGSGLSHTQTVPVGSTVVVRANVSAVPDAVTLRIEAAGAAGAEPLYTFTTAYGVQQQPRRRAVR